MSNVNKVELFSERSSGVPPVVFDMVITVIQVNLVIFVSMAKLLIRVNLMIMAILVIQ